MMLGGVVGVKVWYHPAADAATKEAAEALVAMLNGEGIQAEPKLGDAIHDSTTNVIQLLVGSKR